MELHQRIVQELDRRYAAKLARCCSAEHVPILLRQKHMLEDLLLTVLENLESERETAWD